MQRTLVLLLDLAGLATDALQEPVRMEGGQVTGTPTIRWTYGVRLFRGIPYAAPPEGNLRWRPPQSVVPWQGVKAADHFSAACMQPPTDTEGNDWRDEARLVSKKAPIEFSQGDCIS